MSSELINKVDQILADHSIADRHSYFQLKNYIIGKEHTLHGKMWQCVRELESRRDSVKAIELQIEDINDKLELIDIQKERLKLEEFVFEAFDEKKEKLQELFEKEKNIKFRKLDRNKAQLEKNGLDLVKKTKNIQEEMNYFVQAFDYLKKQGNWKDYDDAKAQEMYWNNKLQHELDMRLALGQPVDVELGKTIEALSNDASAKKQLFELIDNRKKLINLQNQTSKENQ